MHRFLFYVRQKTNCPRRQIYHECWKRETMTDHGGLELNDKVV